MEILNDMTYIRNYNAEKERNVEWKGKNGRKIKMGRERRMKLIRGGTSSSRLFFHVEQRGD